MSHTTTVKQVAITDIRAIQAAVRELRDKGRNVSLKENAVPRMYFDGQFRKAVKRDSADYVIQCQGMSIHTDKPCDVGLVKQDDGTFTPYLDTWGGYVREHCGNSSLRNCPEATESDIALAAFNQAYSKHAAIFAATDQGYVVQSCTTDAGGNVQLSIATGF